MNKKEKKAKRAVVREKRMELLRELDALELQSENETDLKALYELHNKIAEIGKQLQLNVHNPVASRYLDKPYEYNPLIIPRKNVNPIPLTIKMYLDFKKRGLTDTEIGMQLGQTKGYVDRFKRANGITKEYWKEKIGELA